MFVSADIWKRDSGPWTRAHGFRLVYKAHDGIGAQTQPRVTVAERLCVRVRVWNGGLARVRGLGSRLPSLTSVP